MKITEGYMPYLGYQTYYRIVGESAGTKTPLLLLHGGPGSTHNYFEVLDCLADAGRQIIMYDQLGCGLSATPSRPDLWNAKTWVEELIALRRHLGLDEAHILGQSWGGMQAIIYLCDYKPKGVKSLILSSTLSSAKLWVQEQHRMISYMAQEYQDAIRKAEISGDFDEPGYLKANDIFMEQHCASAPDENSPECLLRKKVAGSEAYITGWGPNEYNPTGTLGNYEYTGRLHEINVPTLITSGIHDLSTPLVAKTMYDLIPNAKWELFAESRHMTFVDEHEKSCRIYNEWMEDVEK